MSMIVIAMVVIANQQAFGQSPDMKKQKSYKVKFFLDLENGIQKDEIQYLSALQGGVVDSLAEYKNFKKSPDEAYKALLLERTKTFLQKMHKDRADKLKKEGYKRNIVLTIKAKTYKDVAETALTRFNLMERLIFTREIILINGEIPQADLEDIAQPIVAKIYQESLKKIGEFKNNEK
jgi:hypothetical protein